MSSSALSVSSQKKAFISTGDCTKLEILLLRTLVTRPKIESRFEDVNVLDTVRNYSIGTFIWGSPIVFFVWGLPYSSNRHVTPVSVRGRKGLTCSIRAPHCPRFDTLRQSVSNRA